MPIRPIQTSDAPAAIGPYSQAVQADALVFVSGQLGLEPSTGDLVPGGAGPETEQAMKNIGAILGAASLALSHVARVTIYLTDMATFAQVNEAYARALGETRPARVTVGVSALPKGGHVEIEALAVRT